ncbi:MAG TPA: type II toxin-antitoxin system YafQ family toxin [Candidatus Dependentiae bacterium]|nr:type II toxin-antitoxin system YafQ family toxin [Candidatus Dependentiae bacterium]
MLKLVYLRQFEKDLAKAIKRNKDIEKLKVLITIICEEKVLPAKNRNHKLRGDYNGYWECHIEPDWLLIYKKTDTELILVRLGTHADLFE